MTPRAENSPAYPVIGIPVRDLTFRIQELPARGFKVNASHFEEITGGNALNAAIGIVRLGGQAPSCGPMGDSRETTSRYIFDKLAHEGIDTNDIIHMQGLVTPISNIMIDPSGERTIVTFRDPELWRPPPRRRHLLEDCGAVLIEAAAPNLHRPLRRGAPPRHSGDRRRRPHHVAAGRAARPAASHLVFSSEALQSTAGSCRRCRSTEKDLEADAVVPRRHPRRRRARCGSTRIRICSRPRPFRCTPWIRWARATYSMAPLRSGSPRAKTCRPRCGLPLPPQR